MKCPECAAWTIVAATRDGIKRTRVCANRHRFRTEEVVVTKRPANQARNTAIRADKRHAKVIAEAYGLSVKTVWAIKREQ